MNPPTPSKKISPQMRLLQQFPKSPKTQTPLRGNRFSLLPMISTPPLSHIKKVINPFEVALTERLHLPAICSPSLFHRPSTPPHSSTQFEWTMEQVSALNPATIEAHETQFMNSPDPDMEERAQAAISIYFREQHIVPSPIETMRPGKIFFHADDAEEDVTPPPGKRIGVAQTVLTLPPQLPKDIENILGAYFTFTGDQQQAADVYDQEKIDASLRRKLFGPPPSDTDDEPDVIVMPPPQKNWTNTPENWGKKFRGRNFESPNNRSSFSPNLSGTPIKRETFGSLSPIGKLSGQAARSSTSSIYQSTPERLSSRSSVDMSPDVGSKSMDMSLVDEEPMQLSQNDTLAIHETPMRCRSASRKNLSHSFSQIGDGDVEFFGRTDGSKPTTTTFTRTDSGFNDGSCDTTDNKENLDPMKFPLETIDQDVSMLLPGLAMVDARMMSSTPWKGH